jgi:hypothetical protein
LWPQIQIATKSIEDLKNLFFGAQHQHRPKRQLLLGIGMALGLIGMGTSIYYFRHVAHLLTTEAQAITN